MIGGIVLAAGAGRRFGPGPKQLAPLEGKPLLQHAVDAMLGATAVFPLTIVLGAHAGAVAPAIAPGDGEVVVCKNWEEGMSAGLRAGLKALGDVEWAIVTLGDQPRITSQVIAAVADRAEETTARSVAVRATYGGAPGHPVAFHHGLFGELRSLRGDRGARDLLGRVPVKTIEVGHLCSATDVDTQADLEALSR